MEPETGKPASSMPDAVGGAPHDETTRKHEQETIAASSSSFRGLVGGTGNPSSGSSFGGTKSGPGDSQTVSLGKTFGRYQIRKVLGSGSMGSVFLAHDPQLDRQVALKVPRMEHDATGELSQRLYREARAAATLNHPNICPIYDVSEQDGTCFIAMGYVSGEPLSAYVASKKRQPEREAAKVVRKIALALQEAHAQGILHRDLKPTNIMIDKRGEPIVMDFGVACWFEDQTQTRLTQQGALVGTPAYMSPEQIEGRTKVGPASDVYSLGVLLYQILTGRCPFEGTVLNVISQVLHEPPPDARQFRPDLSPELIAICERAMRKNPAERFPSMLDFAKALTGFLNGSPRTEKPRKNAAEVETIEYVRPKPARPARTAHAIAPALPPLPRRSGRSRPSKRTRKNWKPAAIVAAAVAILLLVGGLIGAMLVRGRTAEATAKQSAATQLALADEPSDGARAVPSPEKTGSPSIAPRPASLPISPAVPASISPTTVSPTTVAPTQPPSPPRFASGRIAASGSQAASAPTLVPGGNTIPPATSTTTVPTPVGVRPQAAQQATNSKSAVGTTAAASGAGAGGNTSPSASAPVPAVASSTAARGEPADADRAGTAAGDDNDAPPSKGARGRRAMRDGPPQDGPPPEGPGGRRPFDGGPPRGMTIEAYFKKLDTNNDGRIDPSELPMHIILRADTNKDGELTLHELQQAFKKRGRKLFAPPTAFERRHLPGMGARPPFDRPDRPERGQGQERPGGF